MTTHQRGSALLPQHEAVFAEAFLRWFQGNPSAARLCLDLFFVAQVWDDLIDKDRDMADEDVHVAFRKLLYDIPLNPFYRQFQDHLVPLFQNAVLQWQTANTLEREQRPGDLPKAYMLRASLYQIFAYVAWLIGGDDWGRHVAPQVWRFYGETLPDFETEMTNA